MEPVVGVFSPPAQVFRVARRGADPFASPAWDWASEDGTFGNRFDDPGAERGLDLGGRFRVVYSATTAAGAFAETLAHFRPSLSLLAKLRRISDDEPLQAQLAGALDPLDHRRGVVPVEWRKRRVLASTVLDSSLQFVDMADPRTHHYLRNALAMEAAARGIAEIDFSTVTGPNRRLTQLCARHLYELRAGDAPWFAGVRYLSRLGPAWECWAIFADRLVHTPAAAMDISPDHPDLHDVCRLFGLSVELSDGEDPYLRP